MYKKHVPYGDYPEHVKSAVMIEGGENPDEVIAFARFTDASIEHSELKELFFVAFADSPWEIDSYTEEALRASIPVEKIEPKHVDERPNGF